MASKLNCSQQYISRNLNSKTGIKCYRKTKSPEYTEEQIAKIKTQCRRLNRFSLGKDFVIDDEHFFPLSKVQVPGNRRFYASDKGNVPPEVKRYFKHKYEKKIMFWIALSLRGISKPFFVPSNNAVNQEVYR